jgi:hypothetical protein
LVVTSVSCGWISTGKLRTQQRTREIGRQHDPAPPKERKSGALRDVVMYHDCSAGSPKRNPHTPGLQDRQRELQGYDGREADAMGDAVVSRPVQSM